MLAKRATFKSIYDTLGEARHQEGVPKNLPKEEKRRRRGPTGKDDPTEKHKEKEKSAFELFWGLQRDLHWTEIPYIMRYNRKKRALEGFAIVGEILIHLAPSSAFNPMQVWAIEQARDKAAADLQLAAATAAAGEVALKGGKKGKEAAAPKLTKAEQIVADNTRKIADKELVADITRIRNSKNSLYSLLSEIKASKPRLVLMVEILKKALDANEREAVFEALWAIEEVGIQEFDAPKPASDRDIFGVRDSSLVYDDYSMVEKVMKEARKLKSKEKDMIRLQLIDMTDSLPPLSKFSHGFRLDPWQKQVLRWIDDGQSVVICAPTSSGKTVLSSYVALIAKKTKIVGESTSRRVTKGSKEKEKGALVVTAADVDGEEDEDDDEDEDDEEEDGEGEREGEGDDWEGREDADAADEDDGDAQLTVEAIRLEDMEATQTSEGAETDNVDKTIADTDRMARVGLQIAQAVEESQRVLFVVPSEPLVWQVASYFSKLLREEGDVSTKVALVTDEMVYNPLKKFDTMPQIVVGTPFALESALTKSRGVVGRFETYKKTSGDILPGGFDHFDWVVFDEVHALDGEEGAALQRLIRAMSCKFLALSATVGNAEQLRGWLQSVKEEQLSGVETITLLPEEQPRVPRPAVNMSVHSVRFINLQRYVWSKGALKSLSPLAAVDDVASLQGGILANSSLSMTPRDCFMLWEEIQKLYPPAAITSASPYNFFGPEERITLQRTKDYEDHLKKELAVLAQNHPIETHELLYNFRLEEPEKEFDMCDLIFDLKEREMLPCLVFHLNAFEAIKLLQSLLAGLEYRQKLAHPTYYMDKIAEKEDLRKKTEAQVKAVGRNAKDLEEKMKSGEISGVEEQDFSVDPYEPHPDYRFTKGQVMTDNEWIELSHEMERQDGFKKREPEAIKNNRGKSLTVLSHALMRGLRRGIGLYIKEVSSPAYRREVQRLATKGKLAVVVSDDSLAFGVNMPFRTCVFTGEMNGELTPLMAQQMSGRAGRRGLDTQGNLVYVGSRSSFIRSLMIGKLSNITGAGHPPRYETMFLQGMLSTRYVGWGRAAVLGGRSLEDFCAGVPPPAESYTLCQSKKALEDLGLIEENEEGQWRPNRANKITVPSLSVAWELRQYLWESISVVRLIPDLCRFMLPVAHTLSEKKSQERISIFVTSFFSIFLLTVDRYECKPGDAPLHENPYFNADARNKEQFDEWAEKFAAQQRDIPEHLAHLRAPVTPETPLCGKLFQCILDRHYMFTLSDIEKQEIKARMWKVGSILMRMHNLLWPDRRYFGVLEAITRACFRHLFYLNSELIRGQITFPDVSSKDTESRSDTAATVVKPSQANRWKEESLVDEPPHVLATPWTAAVTQAALRFKDVKTSTPAATPAQTTDLLAKVLRIFNSLKPIDGKLLRLAAEFTDAALPSAVIECSASRGSPMKIIGTLCWVCLRLRPAVANRFPLYLKAIYETDGEPVDEATIKAWHAGEGEAADVSKYLPACPEADQVTAAEMAKLRTSCNPLIEWLASAEEDEDDDEEEED